MIQEISVICIILNIKQSQIMVIWPSTFNDLDLDMPKKEK